MDKEDSIFLNSYLIDKISVHSGKAISVVEWTPGIPEIILKISDPSEDKSLEAYKLEITGKKIIIEARGSAGIFYGITTLLQLIQQNKKEIFIRSVKISDYPRFSWRGMHLDVSRHFFSPEEIKKYIDLLALHKMNVFHWHLTDDQGWRIEIKKYPELTQIGAFRIAGRDIPWNYEQELSFNQTKNLYGGYYTQEDIKDIVKYAKERHITIVPEIEMPGHSQAALTAYPDLSCSGKPYVKKPDVSFEFTHPYCAGNDATIVFLENVLSEVIELFPSEYIHIGGDEANHSPWENCPKCRLRMKDENLETTADLQAWFIEKIDTFIRAHGRKTIGWDEIMDGNLSRESAVMSWRSANQTLVALSAGYKTVSAASEFLYLNSDQGNPGNRPGSELSLKNVYSFEPLSEAASPEEAERLMGINACIWTENIPDLQTLEKHLLPRLGAVAEIAWTQEGKQNFDEFEKALPSYFEMLDRENTNYWIDSPKGLGDDMFYQDSYELRMVNPLPGTTVHYTLDGTEPTKDSKVYSRPLILKESAVVKARTFLPSGKASETRTAEITRVNLQEASEIMGQKSGLILKTGSDSLSTLDNISLVNEWKSSLADSMAIPPEFLGTDHFVLVFEGYFYAAEDGIYHFYTTSDDGSRLYLDNKLVVDNDGIHGMITAEGAVGLKKGYHPIKLEFFDDRYGEGLKVRVSNSLSREATGTVNFSY